MQVKQNFLVLQKRSLRKEFIICCCFLVSFLIIMHISSKTFLAKDKLFLTLSGSSSCSCCSSLYCSQGKLRENFFCLLPFHTFEAFSLCYHNKLLRPYKIMKTRKQIYQKIHPHRSFSFCIIFSNFRLLQKIFSLINRK